MPHNQQLMLYSVVVDPVKVVKIQLITTQPYRTNRTHCCCWPCKGSKNVGLCRIESVMVIIDTNHEFWHPPPPIPQSTTFNHFGLGSISQLIAHKTDLIDRWINVKNRSLPFASFQGEMSVSGTDFGDFLKALIINSSEIVETRLELIRISSELISTSLELIRTIAA